MAARASVLRASRCGLASPTAAAAVRQNLPSLHLLRSEAAPSWAAAPLSSLARPTAPSCFAHPSKYVSGVTPEMLETDPAIRAFYEANYPDHESEPDVIEPSKYIDERRAKKLEMREGWDQDDGKHPDPELDRLNLRRIYCYPRSRESESGSRRGRSLRSRRLIPGIIYGSDPTRGILSFDFESRVPVKTPWRHIQRELDRYHRGFPARVYELTVFPEEGDDYDSGAEPLSVERVVPADVNMHPVNIAAYCCNFLRYHPGRPINIPIRYINEEESAAMKRGAFIAPINRNVNVIVEEGVPVPEFIDLECTGVKLKDVLRTERLILPDGVAFSDKVKKDQFLVGTVFGSRRGLLEERAAEAAQAVAAKEG
eukprot:CAMPEP_0183295792 /NCGR_PEP_ID=MMETSP0160_2-20130417/3616_1 /TAXON_ID=2839 ORGANISM="Odontella Sinensis, Strain Grunow 1884" /NCGR_SAMPLE_ID=MMETSP0160_2 /ASSEMBLY_ACC=CAM_ASM_000250 /LENGTH=368 /DNA_ID=CAMNT_0025457325 /DNA_START=7 /DNA_END=1113 /DNA_ORIENTATION=-